MGLRISAMAGTHTIPLLLFFFCFPEPMIPLDVRFTVYKAWSLPPWFVEDDLLISAHLERL